MQSTQEATLYEQLAADLTRQIRAGSLRSGTRIPSIRQLAQQRGVSISTAIQSLRMLEENGLIEARPQSGYYVSSATPKLAPPTEPPLHLTETLVGQSEIIWRMIKAGQRGALPFSAAVLDPALLPHGTLQRLVSSLARRHPKSLTTYTLPPGSALFRESLAAQYGRWGCGVHPDEVVVTNGCMEAINLCLRAATQPGDLVALESPTYFGLVQAIESQHLKVVEIPAHPVTGLSLDALQLTLKSLPVKAVIASPNLNNPLGSVMPPENKKKLVELVSKARIPLIEDDVYGDFVDAQSRALPAKAYDRDGSVMLCSSFTKALAPGFRLGWAAAGRYQAKVELLKLMNSCGSSIFQEMVLAEFLNSGGYELHLRKLRRNLDRQRQQYAAAIGRHFPASTRLSCPAGGYIFWLELPSGIDTAQLLDQAVALGVNFAPGIIFSATGRDFSNCLRLSAGYQFSAEIEQGLRQLGTLVTQALKEKA